MFSKSFRALSNFFTGKIFEDVISKKEVWIIIFISALTGVLSAYVLPAYISYWLPILALIIIIKL